MDPYVPKDSYRSNHSIQEVMAMKRYSTLPIAFIFIKVVYYLEIQTEYTFA